MSTACARRPQHLSHHQHQRLPSLRLSLYLKNHRESLLHLMLSASKASEAQTRRAPQSSRASASAARSPQDLQACSRASARRKSRRKGQARAWPTSSSRFRCRHRLEKTGIAMRCCLPCRPHGTPFLYSGAALPLSRSLLRGRSSPPILPTSRATAISSYGYLGVLWMLKLITTRKSGYDAAACALCPRVALGRVYK